MTIPAAYHAAKIATGAVAALSVAVFAIDPSVQVAIIVAAASVFASTVAAVLGVFNILMQKKQAERFTKLEVNVDGRLTQLLQKTEQAATAEGFAEGRKEGVSVTETEAKK